MKHAVTSGIGILAICMTGCSNSVTAKLYPVKKGAYPEQRPIPVVQALVGDVQRSSGM